MTRPSGQLDRSLAALTLGVADGRQERHRALSDNRTGEYEQQVHLPIAGNAGSDPGFADATVHWEMPFLYAPAQRRVPFPTPHFTYGVEHLQATDILVSIDVHVIGWVVSPEGWYTGSTVRASAHAPGLGAGMLEPFSAIVHLSFQGYASFAEGAEFQ